MERRRVIGQATLTTTRAADRSRSWTLDDLDLEIASRLNSLTTTLFRHNGLQARSHGLQKQQQSSARPRQTTTPPLIRRLFRFP